MLVGTFVGAWDCLMLLRFSTPSHILGAKQQLLKIGGKNYVTSNPQGHHRMSLSPIIKPQILRILILK
jgi:hypothetical protein